MDRGTAQILDNCEARLRLAQALVSQGRKLEAKQAFSEARALAREAVVAGGGRVPFPGSLGALSRWQSHPKGYWSSLA
jgi:hypothetical protein